MVKNSSASTEVDVLQRFRPRSSLNKIRVDPQDQTMTVLGVQNLSQAIGSGVSRPWNWIGQQPGDMTALREQPPLECLGSSSVRQFSAPRKGRSADAPNKKAGASTPAFWLKLISLTQPASPILYSQRTVPQPEPALSNH